MPSVPTLPSSTLAVGDTPTAAWFDQVGLYLAFLAAKPVFECPQLTAQSIPNSAASPFTAITFDGTAVVDSASGHSAVTNNSRYTAQYAGLYDVSGLIQVQNNATGYRALFISLNGTLIAASEATANPTAAGATTIATRYYVQMAVNDFVELRLFQSSGGALPTIANQSVFQCEWVRS